jgi:hypothetical protein
VTVAVATRPASRLAPHKGEHERSVERAMYRGRMPKSLGALLAWFSSEWDAEIPPRLHTVEVWHGRQEYRDGEKVWPAELVGGSALGSHGLTDRFRRHMEAYAGERDQDGWYLRPMHAALARLGTRDHWMARNLFAVAMAGYDWQGVADRGHWVHGMYQVYLEEALRRLWLEYSERALRAP